MEIFGIRLVGFNEENAWKILLTLLVFVVVFILKWIVRRFLLLFGAFEKNRRLRFWSRQGFALQKVVTSLAGYLIIIRGKTFSVGERITMGGIRGDVISLGFLQTTIMEMGQPPSVQGARPAMWVAGREFTGRIVTVTNDKIFKTPVYNYSRDFPFLWEEMEIPIKFDADIGLAEKILLECVEKHTAETRNSSLPLMDNLKWKYGIVPDDTVPRVYMRITDNWLELTVRFIVNEHGIRKVKDAITRDILERFKEAGIDIASSSFEVVGLPHLKLEDGPISI